MIDPIEDIRASFAQLLEETQAALDRRVNQYPALVAACRMTEQDAANEIRIWRAIVADWRWVVTGEGNWTAAIEEKVAVLEESIRRYGSALRQTVAGMPPDVRKSCQEIKDLHFLSDLHGQSVTQFLTLLENAERLEDIRAVYASELPGNPPWRGLWRGMAQYLAFHHDARMGRRARTSA
ncbi:MAG: hypothetical protein AB7E60_11525 [Sphingobium sp.]